MPRGCPRMPRNAPVCPGMPWDRVRRFGGRDASAAVRELFPRAQLPATSCPGGRPRPPLLRTVAGTWATSVMTEDLGDVRRSNAREPDVRIKELNQLGVDHN